MATSSHVDQRLVRLPLWRRMMQRQEFGPLFGLVFILALFVSLGRWNMFTPEGINAWIVVFAQFAIIGVGASLLMIGGEFDLSIGSTIAFVSIFTGLLVKELQVPILLTVFITLGVALLFGFLNGIVTVKSGLPSFIVTLSSLFIIKGLAVFIGITVANASQISGLYRIYEGSRVAAFFGSDAFQGLFLWMGEIGWIGLRPDGVPWMDGIPAIVLWMLVLAGALHFLLVHTRYGNWIYASGGDPQAARYVGIPVKLVKVQLFMLTSFCAWLFATCQAFGTGNASASSGELKELEAIVAAVVGGTILKGGYGTVIGAVIGALIFALVKQGLIGTGLDQSLYRVFLGGFLLAAVILNNMIRNRIVGNKD